MPEVVLFDFVVHLPHNLHSWHELMIIKSFKTSAVSLKNRLTLTIGAGQSSFIVLLRAVIHRGDRKWP